MGRYENVVLGMTFMAIVFFAGVFTLVFGFVYQINVWIK